MGNRLDLLKEMITSGFIVFPLVALWFAFFSKQEPFMRVWMVVCCGLLMWAMIP